MSFNIHRNPGFGKPPPSTITAHLTGYYSNGYIVNPSFGFRQSHKSCKISAHFFIAYWLVEAKIKRGSVRDKGAKAQRD